MKKSTIKIINIMLIVLSLLIISTNVFAASSKEIQIAKTEKGDYIIYVKDLMASEGFKFAITEEKGLEPNSIDLNYINSVTDGEGNQVALIEKNTVEENKEIQLYIGDTETALDLSKAFDVADMEQVEETTNRIKTELKTNVEQRNEVVDGVQYTETVGGLEISDKDREKATYEYISTKLPAEKYSELQKLANELSSGTYKEKDMYSKIEFANKFNELYKELINEATWQPVQNYLIKQPIEAQKDDRYIVLLKKTAKDGTTTYDAKFMISYREDEEKSIPGRTETIIVQETTKLPITGDSIILFAVVAIIVIALIVVFIRMKKLKNKENQ
ncbi:MAG: hypothetical protein IJV31_07650 [Clostridia bacterium]|nr:hypothetical protein [Clostridia bacterium]